MNGFRYLLLVLGLQYTQAKEQEMTVEIGPGKEECFFESVQKGYTLGIDYQVIDAGSGQYAELDINFRVMDPRGHPIMATFKKQDGTFNQKVNEVGDYKICFDNTFSYLSSKTVYFEMINENEEEVDYDDLAGIFPDYADEGDEGGPQETFEVSAADIEAKLKKIKEDMDKARHTQDLLRVTDTKDRIVAEHNFERVNFMSCFYLIIIICSGLVQVVLIRSLLDDKSRINPLWKKVFQD